MNPYERWVLPRLVDWTMRLPLTLPYRMRMVAAARGVVLEIGVGTGANLPRYGQSVAQLYGLDPSAAMLKLAAGRVPQAAVPVELLCGAGASLPFADATFDTVVATFTLCSIPDTRAALAEVRRVLRPGGAFVFVEHGRSPDAAIARWQDRITPLWRRLAGGCHLNREPERLVRGAGLRLEHLAAGYASGPRIAAYVYEGRAVRV